MIDESLYSKSFENLSKQGFMPKAGLFIESLFLHMSWRVLYIEESDYLNLYLDNLKIKKGIDETTVPLSDINSIIVDNNKTNISLSLINKCMEYKVNIITCDIYHLPNGIIIPYSGNYQSALQLRKQIEWKEETKNIIWQYIIKKKILNQAKILELKDKDIKVINHMIKFSNEVKINDKTNREGIVAKIYFRELFGSDFKRMNDDIINAGLNYGYSILRSQISRELVARGLNLHLGLFHNSITNQFNLADDIIEVYRPIIDSYVYDELKDKLSFLRENRLELIKITTKKVMIAGKKQTITNSMNIMINSILKVIETGDINELVFPDSIIYE